MPHYADTWTLKEIDRSRGDPKGTAFRAFKRLKAGFIEGHDFFYLSASEDAESIEQLRDSGRIYAATINALLFPEASYQAIVKQLDTAS
ncbi:hypothetical protein [Vreelandella subglaciescola]|jgi:hypothetical protein|uniref:Uncharacterized protein n=1 Tax=Vreelandella subglaciescola TaxID=29571 RepID=A0A1M7EVC5_9GAMM|nr:hypothetical protein [Halomonas subglaciescola]SHL95752.1 hypothetical protein SAMN05878437_0472 [Halomonas subglaciescola]